MHLFSKFNLIATKQDNPSLKNFYLKDYQTRTEEFQLKRLIKVSDPESFKKAHDKVTQQLSKAIGDRTVGFGSYDIGGYNGATHWVIVTAEDWEDLMLQKVEYEKYTKHM